MLLTQCLDNRLACDQICMIDFHFVADNLCQQKGCDQICTVTDNVAQCDCQIGFILAADQVNCYGMNVTALAFRHPVLCIPAA